MVLATLDFKTGRPAVTAPARGQYVAASCWVGPDELMFEILADRTSTDPSSAGVATLLGNTTKNKYYLGHWLVDANLTKMQQVPTLEHVLVVVDPLPQDPARVLLAQQRSDEFYSPLYCYDPVRNKTRLLERNPGRIIAWLTDTAGLVRLAAVAEQHGNHSYLYRETEQSAWQPLLLPENTDFITFDPTGRYLLISFPDKAGRLVMQPFDLVTRQLTDQPVADPVYDIDPVAIRDPRTGAARALDYFTEKSHVHLAGSRVQRTAETARRPLFPDAVVYPIGTTQTGEVLVLTYADVSPPQYFLFNLQRRQLRLYLDECPKVRGLTLSPMKPVTFKASDGAALYGYLTLPAGHIGAKPPPLIAIAHGGPLIRDRLGL